MFLLLFYFLMKSFLFLYTTIISNLYISRLSCPWDWSASFYQKFIAVIKASIPAQD